MPARGLFITLEGIDRSGKSTQARMLAEALGPQCVAVREPGGTTVGERVRELVKDPAVTLDPAAEALLFAAARAQLVAAVIEPALARGQTVVCDRFLDSALAYQGVARGLGVDAVREANDMATGGLVPDLTLLLDIDPAGAHARSGTRDRFEAEGEALQGRVAEAYRELAAAEPHRWRSVDARRSPEEIHRVILELVHREGRTGEREPV